MLKYIIQFLSRCSGHLKLDLFWRLTQLLLLKDRRILTARLLLQEADQVTFKRKGIIWTVPTKDQTIFPNLFVFGHYQGMEIKKIVRWMKNQGRFDHKQDVIIDIGANIGSTCISFAAATDCRIVAIEPYPEIFQLLQKNVIQNGLQNRITCIQKAVFNQSGFVKMFMHLNNLGNVQIKRVGLNVHTPNGDYQTTDHIPSEPLMDILFACRIKKEHISFIWSDTEGCEVEVLQTGIPLWETGIPVYMEIQPRLLEMQNNMEQLIELTPKYFNRFITRTDLIHSGENATVRSVEMFRELIDQLIKNKSDTDVLLLPKAFKLKKHSV